MNPLCTNCGEAPAVTPAGPTVPLCAACAALVVNPRGVTRGKKKPAPKASV